MESFDLHNTIGLNLCPAEVFDSIDVAQVAGRPVHLLRSPDDVTWVMQSFTTHIAADLTEADLPALGDRLQLPDGWRFKTVVIEQDLVIDTAGLANIVPDELANMYQGCLDGVNNFDPGS